MRNHLKWAIPREVRSKAGAILEFFDLGFTLLSKYIFRSPLYFSLVLSGKFDIFNVDSTRICEKAGVNQTLFGLITQSCFQVNIRARTGYQAPKKP